MKLRKIVALVSILTLLAVPSFAARGRADFSKFVAIGDSYGAGYANNGLNERHQNWSWPAVVARQVGYRLCSPNDTAASNCFSQALVSYPGLQPELTLLNLQGGIGLAPGQGAALMSTWGAPYNNLAVPGANVADTLNATGAPAQNNPVATLILRGLGTQVQQALVQQPTFIAVWIGGNDFLGAATQGQPSRLTPAADFRTSYERLLDTLIAGAPDAGMVVGNLPTNIAGTAYFNTVPRVLVNPATRQPILGPDGNPIPLIADLGGGTIGPLPAGSFVALPAASKIATGFGIPPTLASIPPFNQLPNVGRPLLDTDVVTPTEATAILARVAEYNTIINNAAAARNIPVADIAGLFNRLTPGFQLGPVALNGSFVSGGFFSLDGVHLTDLGYMLFANEFIRAINQGYDTEIPFASIAQLYANNGAFFPELDGQSVRSIDALSLSNAAADALRTFWAPKAPRRGRAATH
jgi:lysophospholipase L1-like esterase